MTLAAFRRVKQGASAVRIVPRLYCIAFSFSRLKTVRAGVEAVLDPGAWLPPLELGVEDDTVTTAVNVSAFWAD